MLRYGASLRREYGLCQSTLYRIGDSEAAPWLNLFPFSDAVLWLRCQQVSVERKDKWMAEADIGDLV